MAEAKDIDDSLDFLRFFEKYTENPDLGTLIQEKISPDKKGWNSVVLSSMRKILKLSPIFLQSRTLNI